MKWIWYYFLCCVPAALTAQKSYPLQFIPDVSDSRFVFKTGFQNKVQAELYLSKLPALLQTAGYLAASVDSFRLDSLQGSVWLYMGRRYQWVIMKPEAADSGFKEVFAGSKRVKDAEAYRTSPQEEQAALLTHFADNGYPFASVGLDNIRISGDSLFAGWHILQGPKYLLDSVHLGGSLRLKPSFLYRYLQLKKGMPYNQRLLDNIDSRLSQLNFAEAPQPMTLGMLGSGATANLYLNATPSNIINVLLGVMPNSTQTPDKKVQISGDANILLRNAFNNGESLGLNWQQLQYKSPRMVLFFQQPFLFGTGVGSDLYFDLFKKDSQFVNINLRVGASYQVGANGMAKVFYNLAQTMVNTVDTVSIKATRKLPAINDLSVSNLGVDFGWNTTNYRLNPQSGWEVMLVGMAGLKKLKPNNAVTVLKDPLNSSFSYAGLYDSLKQNTYQLKVRVNAARYLSTGSKTVLKLALQGGWLQSQNYFKNELFQIGGARLLRGFDEESIFARQFAVITAEYRLIASKKGYFFTFADGGIAGYRDQLSRFSHSYIGMGLGLAVDAKNSLINISWAIGKRDDLSLDLRQSKIHLGLINFF